MLHLQRGDLVVEDFLNRRRHVVNDAALALLQACDVWRSADELTARFPAHRPASVLGSADLLRRKGLLVAEGTPEAARQKALEAWAPWDHAGTYFHFWTRKTRFAQTDAEADAVVARITRRPMPPIYKDMPGPRLPLVAPSPRLAPAPLGDALFKRRTWREFVRKPLPRRLLEAVTVLTFGRLGFVDGGAFGKLLHRASPSGGARHPLECYVMALDVTGIAPGLYHYSVRENALVKLRDDASRDRIEEFTFGQGWFADAAAVFVITAVFARTMWKYRIAKAYKVLLLETGHLCQNLVLTATSLGLGAYQVAALDIPSLERYLGIDGATEGAVCLAGIGWPDWHRFRRAARSGLLPGGPV